MDFVTQRHVHTWERIREMGEGVVWCGVGVCRLLLC